MRPRDLLAQPGDLVSMWDRLKIDTDARIRERNAQRRAAACQEQPDMSLQSFDVTIRNTKTLQSEVLPIRGRGIGDVQCDALDRCASRQRQTGIEWRVTRIEPR